MKKFTILICLLMSGFFSLQATQIEVLDGGSISDALSSTSSGDTIILADGGSYSPGSLMITDNKRITFMTKPGAAIPAQVEGNFRLDASKTAILLENIEFTGGDNYFIMGENANDTASLVSIKDCSVHGYGRCLLRLKDATDMIDSVIFDNSNFYDFDDSGYQLFNGGGNFKTSYFKIVNSTINGFNESAIVLTSTDVALEFIMDNSSISFKNGEHGADVIQLDGAIGSSVLFRNSTFTHISGTGALFSIGGDVIDSIQNCAFYFDETACDTANTWSYKSEFNKTDPSYVDTTGYDLTISTSSALMTAGTDGGAIGDPRWVQEVIEPVSSSIIACWKLDDEGSIATDSMGISNGTCMYTGDTLWTEGYVDGAMDFTKGCDSAYIEVPSNTVIDFDSTTSFTISALVYVESAEVSSNINVVFKGATGTDDDGEGKWYNLGFKSNEVRFVVDDNVEKTQVAEDISDLLTTREWAHLVGVRDLETDSLYVYLNGTKIASEYDITEYDIASSTRPLIIGNNANIDMPFNGKLDEIRMYDTALSSAQILAMTTSYGIEQLVIPEPKSTNCNLADLQVDGVTVEGFSASEVEYSVELGSDVTTIPTVTATAEHDSATVEVEQAESLTGSATVIVTAEDGTTAKYTVTFTAESEEASTDATLSDLQVDGATIDGFSADVTSYTAELAEGTTSVSVTATTTDDGAQVSGTGDVDVSSGSGKSTITVLAEDMSNSKTYTIDFTVTSVGDGTAINTTAETFNAFYIRSNNSLVISNPEGLSMVQIYSLNGMAVANITDGISSSMDMSGYGLENNSIYLIRLISSNGETETLKILK